MTRTRLERAIAVLGNAQRAGSDEFGRHASERCPLCRGDLEFVVVQAGDAFDGVTPGIKPGEVVGYCPTCSERIRRRNPKPKGYASQQVSIQQPRVGEADAGVLDVPRLAPAAILPPVAPGQLRCQRCACGVEKNSHRFCLACRQKSARRNATGCSLSPESRAAIGAAKRVWWQTRTFAPRNCACGQAFTPLAANDRRCPSCRAAVPGRS